ncbi:DUF4329 domain-containing protein [Erythrobacter sp. F6033]|uniref:DUF4329 domain-containing protein n=1 Tax=Erythrobacter sp. F6033 TaxID=2926401 RepID=UPI001FF24D7C|nr:DUF4329 domain-containing protein [Erythrobacter sp. F6033]MCK0128501.1 DUF4329 domain-containing protein [Erythrobacter sp. F6033]
MNNTRSTTLIIFGLCGLAWVVIVGRAYFNVKGPEDFVVTTTQSEVQAFARAQLDALQERSFAEDIELCGIIFERSNGELGASSPRPGDEASCGIAFFDEPGMKPLASFHTHAAQNDQYDSEVPSVLDMRSDSALGMDGYLATPGGRFWWIDGNREIAKMVCGEGCLAQDTNYELCDAYEPESEYDIPTLMGRFRDNSTDC